MYLKSVLITPNGELVVTWTRNESEKQMIQTIEGRFIPIIVDFERTWEERAQLNTPEFNRLYNLIQVLKEGENLRQKNSLENDKNHSPD